MSLGLKHLQKRKRFGRVGRTFDTAVYFAAFVSPFALLPQVYALFTSKDASNLSLITWTILGLGNCVWLVYGLYHNEKPIIVTNALLAIFNFLIVLGIVMYS